ncbi:MAG: hypothetical protein COB17_07375 [Sulfurimonas sp.]|nr:MAG: hypothetical protein COB17_07375 [Sulfurimonas sp.]
MKKILTFSILFIFISIINSDELSWVDEQVKAIKPARPGINNSIISNIKDPFLFLEKNGFKNIKKEIKKKHIVKIKKTKYKIIKKYMAKLNLEMIINSSVLINGSWYNIGDYIKGQLISKVYKTSIILNYNGKKSTLSIQKKKYNLKFKKK